MKFHKCILGASLVCLALLSACSDEKEEMVPQIMPQKAKTPVVKPAETEEPELQPMVAAQESAEPAKVAEIPLSVVQEKSGSYVIQVGIQPSKKGANTIVANLKEKGVYAYISEVENPGELEGTYYRVRIGYFSTIQKAQDFGKQVLESAGFPWWIDNKQNDSVGNPSSESDSYETSKTEFSAADQTEPVSMPVESQPVAEEVEQPAADVPMEDASTSIADESTVPAPALEIVEE